MADVLRSCAKTGCRWPAAASLSYRYATRQVWLLDLAPSPDPSLYDLCPHHADHLVVPKGWERVDDRSAEDIMVEPSAFDRAEHAARRRRTSVEPVPRQAVAARPPQLVGAGAGAGVAAGRNRYAALAEQLPKLAAEQAAHAAHPVAAESAASQSVASQSVASQSVASQSVASQSVASHSDAVPGPLADRGRMGPTTGAGRPAAPTPAHELAPRAVDDMTPPSSAEAAGPDEAPPGQLSIPVDDETSGVVLQFDLAGGRRRGKST